MSKEGEDVVQGSWLQRMCDLLRFGLGGFKSNASTAKPQSAASVQVEARAPADAPDRKNDAKSVHSTAAQSQSSAATRGKGILKQAESSPEAQRPVSILEGLGRVLRGNAEKNEGDFGAASGIADCLGLELGQRDGKVLLSDIFEGSPAAQRTEVHPCMTKYLPLSMGAALT
eukprot:3668704-Rhodomonas_salina.3